MAKYYGVKKGRKVGVFSTWKECQNSVNGFSGPEFKSFKSKEDADEFVYGNKNGKIDNEDVLVLNDSILDETQWILQTLIEAIKDNRLNDALNYVENLADSLDIKL